MLRRLSSFIAPMLVAALVAEPLRPLAVFAVHRTPALASSSCEFQALAAPVCLSEHVSIANHPGKQGFHWRVLLGGLAAASTAASAPRSLDWAQLFHSDFGTIVGAIAVGSIAFAIWRRVWEARSRRIHRWDSARYEGLIENRMIERAHGGRESAVVTQATRLLQSGHLAAMNVGARVLSTLASEPEAIEPILSTTIPIALEALRYEGTRRLRGAASHERGRLLVGLLLDLARSGVIPANASECLRDVMTAEPAYAMNMPFLVMILLEPAGVDDDTLDAILQQLHRTPFSATAPYQHRLAELLKEALVLRLAEGRRLPRRAYRLTEWLLSAYLRDGQPRTYSLLASLEGLGDPPIISTDLLAASARLATLEHGDFVAGQVNQALILFRSLESDFGQEEIDWRDPAADPPLRAALALRDRYLVRLEPDLRDLVAQRTAQALETEYPPKVIEEIQRPFDRLIDPGDASPPRRPPGRAGLFGQPIPNTDEPPEEFLRPAAEFVERAQAVREARGARERYESALVPWRAEWMAYSAGPARPAWLAGRWTGLYESQAALAAVLERPWRLGASLHGVYWTALAGSVLGLLTSIWAAGRWIFWIDDLTSDPNSRSGIAARWVMRHLSAWLGPLAPVALYAGASVFLLASALLLLRGNQWSRSHSRGDEERTFLAAAFSMVALVPLVFLDIGPFFSEAFPLSVQSVKLADGWTLFPYPLARLFAAVFIAAASYLVFIGLRGLEQLFRRRSDPLPVTRTARRSIRRFVRSSLLFSTLATMLMISTPFQLHRYEMSLLSQPRGRQVDIVHDDLKHLSDAEFRRLIRGAHREGRPPRNDYNDYPPLYHLLFAAGEPAEPATRSFYIQPLSSALAAAVGHLSALPFSDAADLVTDAYVARFRSRLAASGIDPRPLFVTALRDAPALGLRHLLKGREGPGRPAALDGTAWTMYAVIPLLPSSFDWKDAVQKRLGELERIERMEPRLPPSGDWTAPTPVGPGDLRSALPRVFRTAS